MSQSSYRGDPSYRTAAITALEAARALLDDPKHWTQKRYAANKRGEEANPVGPEAVCWCSLGALAKVTRSSIVRETPTFWHAQGLLESELSVSVIRFNDDPRRTHADVLAAFDRAIARVKGTV